MILNWGKKISNQGRDYKSGQDGFQIGAGTANRCRTLVKPAREVLWYLMSDFFFETV